MIYLFLANGFEEIEALATVDILRRAGHQIATVGVGGKSVRGSHQIGVIADLAESEADTDGLEMVILPGGMPGARNLEKSAAVRDAVTYCFQNDRYVAAICAAPSVLGHMGLLKGRRATCFPGFEAELLGAQHCPDQVCVDGKLITADGPGAAIPFALKIVEQLSGREASEELGKSMQCR